MTKRYSIVTKQLLGKNKTKIVSIQYTDDEQEAYQIYHNIKPPVRGRTYRVTLEETIELLAKNFTGCLPDTSAKTPKPKK